MLRDWHEGIVLSYSKSNASTIDIREIHRQNKFNPNNPVV